MKMVTTTILSLTLTALCMVSAVAQDATVTSVTGKVQMQKGSDWIALQTGDTVTKGSIISTGFKSEAQIDINGSKLTLGPLTRTTIEQMTSNTVKDETKLYLDSGVITANVQHQGNKRVDFKVRSPAATASVRGTDFTMTASGTLTTHEGLVSKQPPEASHAEVAETEEATDFVPEAGTSTALTSTKEVSGEFGIPVFANQTSTTNELTGISTSPQQEKVMQTQTVASTTATPAETEAIASVASSLATAVVETEKGTGTSTAVISITVSF